MKRWLRLRPRRLKVKAFSQDWHDLQEHCRSRKTWPLAITKADALLERALKARGYKGKTTGERLVAAQHELSNNENVWFAHKLSQKIGSQDVRKLKKQDVLMALSGVRQALRDLGALES